MLNDSFVSAASINLSEISKREKELTDEELLDMLVAKHRFQDHGKIVHIAIIDFLT